VWALDLNAPDYTTLSRRNQTVEVPPLARVHEGKLYLGSLIEDSIGRIPVPGFRATRASLPLRVALSLLSQE